MKTNLSNLEQCPDTIKVILLKELNRHVYDKEGKYKSEAQIKREMSESFGYILKMYWLGRGDKFSDEIKPALQWITQNLLNPHLADKFTEFKNHQAQFQGENHEELSQEAMNNLFNLMKSTPGINLPRPEEKFSIKKLFKLK